MREEFSPSQSDIALSENNASMASFKRGEEQMMKAQETYIALPEDRRIFLVNAINQGLLALGKIDSE